MPRWCLWGKYLLILELCQNSVREHSYTKFIQVSKNPQMETRSSPGKLNKSFRIFLYFHSASHCTDSNFSKWDNFAEQLVQQIEDFNLDIAIKVRFPMSMRYSVRHECVHRCKARMHNLITDCFHLPEFLINVGNK